MMQYILESVAFQLLFLIIYDVFLKRETFFQWNRAYLLATFLLSLLLPWMKIEALKITVSKKFMAYPEYLWGMDMGAGTGVLLTAEESQFMLSWQEMLLYGGMVLAAVLFIIKLVQIRQLKNRGEVHYFDQFTRVVVAKSNIAFSFFKTIFLGEEVLKKEHESILQHELVHIQQRHSLDLMFFELMRIAFWFNPLVYVYQNRISELHEFIADAKVSKSHQREHYQNLLSQVFQTQHISFINQFFKSSLIKKRIVMLQKSRSRKVWQLKYLLLLPLIVGMLFYTSCEGVENTKTTEEEQHLEATESTGNTNEISVSFAVIDQVPVFPGCEDAEDKKACFHDKIQEHVRKNFHYPEEANNNGIQGRVSVMFTIDEKGNIINIRKRGPHRLLEDETERIIARLPKMLPGIHNGQAVTVPFSIPITFKIEDGQLDNKGVKENQTKKAAEFADNEEAQALDEMFIVGYGPKKE
ncbi:M56 family metallopeptidase [Sediminicola sp. 1XM1-17]|uniref:M56 family metallopeptidase n=1 Tax=Sediminicola sp. 1XM1-17 TaxID=3127702 RepID=UPI003078638E